MSDARLFFPATERNRDAILGVIRPLLADRIHLVEIASGSGEHAMHFARHLPHLTLQPTDLEPDHLRSIDAWRAHEALGNVRPALPLDVTAAWPALDADAIFCANMIHIAPYEAAEGLIRGAADLLASGCPLLLYGPFRIHGEHTAPSNEHFDARLRARDPAWGVRDLDAITALADDAGFDHEATVEMPANNLTVVYRRR